MVLAFLRYDVYFRSALFGLVGCIHTNLPKPEGAIVLCLTLYHKMAYYKGAWRQSPSLPL